MIARTGESAPAQLERADAKKVATAPVVGLARALPDRVSVNPNALAENHVNVELRAAVQGKTSYIPM